MALTFSICCFTWASNACASPMVVPPSRADAALRDQRRLDGSKVQTAAINAMLHAVNKLARDVDIAGAVPRLDERLQLPIVGSVFVVAQSVRQRYGGLAFFSLGAQAQVNAKDGAFAGRLRKHLGDPLRKTNEVFALRQS